MIAGRISCAPAASGAIDTASNAATLAINGKVIPMRATAALLACLAAPAGAHEFWISPTDYTPAPGEATSADLRVGERFSGAVQAYFPNSITRFDVVAGDAATPVEGTVGDRPAMAPATLPEGLAVIVHETGDSRLTYTEAAKFARFAAHKGFPEIAVGAQMPVTELYRRYAKSLIGVGSAAGADAPVGLYAELTALTNPYTDDLLGGMTVRLTEAGAPVPDYQIEVFALPPGAEAATIETYLTDADGAATFPVAPGTQYMVDSVLMRPLPDRDDADWFSHWANLTFETPGA